MKLNKEQYTLLSRIFHHRHDGWVATDKGRQEEPVVTFSTCVVVVEDFLSRVEPSRDDLTVEDIAQVEMWQEAMRTQPGLAAVTIVLADGKTEYTVKKRSK